MASIPAGGDVAPPLDGLNIVPPGTNAGASRNAAAGPTSVVSPAFTSATQNTYTTASSGDSRPVAQRSQSSKYGRFRNAAAEGSDLEANSPLDRVSSHLSNMTAERRERMLRKLTARSGLSQAGDSSAGGADEDDEEDDEFSKLLKEIFDREEMKQKRVGVLFKDLTVKGKGVGADTIKTVGFILKKLPLLPLLPIALPALLIKKCVSKKPSDGTNALRTLLHSFDGCVRDGEMLLVLGNPGSGCSTFLKTIANQRAGYVSVDGDVLYGGIDAKEMADKYRGEVVYNAEVDDHYASLTVEQTLRFAVKSRTPNERPKGETPKMYQDRFLEVLGAIFGIDHVMNTPVGDALRRGVSGGEKKRVSIAEVMSNRASVACWDNSSRGLDASTSVEYVKSLRVLTNISHGSSIVSLYQAGESLYNYFDKVLLIMEGRCLFFGPAQDARAYFEELGFEPQPRQTSADFLTAVTDKSARRIKHGKNPPTSAEALEKAYRNSDAYQKTLKDMQAFEEAFKKADLPGKFREVQADKKGKRKSIYPQPFWRQVYYCTVRSYQITLGDKFAFFGKNASAIIQSLISGSLFYNASNSTNGAFLMQGAIFLSVLFNTLLALAELSNAFSARPILAKHRSFTFFRPSALAIASVLADIPVVALQVLAFSFPIYFMAKLQRTAGQFFQFYFFLWLTSMSSYSLFRMLGSLLPTLDVATPVSGILLQALLVYCGYFLPTRSMRPWFRWINFATPLSFGFEALSVNQFSRGLELECVPPRLVPYGGNYPSQGCAIPGSTVGSTVVNGASYMEAAFGYELIHLWRNFAILFGFWMSSILLTCIGMELQRANAGGGGAIIYKPGGAPKQVEKALEGEKVADAAQLAADEAAEERSDDQVEQAMENFEKSESIFTFDNVTYKVPTADGQKTLLDGVSGYVKPGCLTCMIGSSGAGKTTLLNTLAQRQSVGVVTGSMLVDGRPLPKAFQRSTGYCEQMDIHEPTATVREALRFSALLRQPKSTPIEEKYKYVEEVIRLLEMEYIAEAIIGEPGAGLSIEQRKRLTLGVELVSRPSLLLFLDEPTSGLDSQASWNLVRFLKVLAAHGQALLVTIHQPSANLVAQFENILILGRGGKTIYFGPLGENCSKMIEYFESHGSDKCPKEANPAEWVLDVIGAGGGIGAKKATQDWPQIWRDGENEKVRKEIAVIKRDRGDQPNKYENDTEDFAMPWSTQTVAVTRRVFVSYWRTRQYVIGKTMLHIFAALFNGFSYYKLGNSTQDQQNRLFSIFLILVISPPLIQQLQPRFLAYRNLYTARERQSSIYHFSSVVTSSFLVEVPYSVVAGSLYFCAYYFSVGFPRGVTAVTFWMYIMLLELWIITFGQMIAAFSPSAFFASIVVPLLFSMTVSFCGVLVPAGQIVHFWQWLVRLTPFRYMLEGLLSLATHNEPIRCAANEFARFAPPGGQTCQEYAGTFIQRVGGYLNDPSSTTMCEFCQYAVGDEYTATLGVYYVNRWRDYGIFWAYIVFNLAMTYFFTWLYCHGVAGIKSTIAARKSRKAAGKDEAASGSATSSTLGDKSREKESPERSAATSTASRSDNATAPGDAHGSGGTGVGEHPPAPTGSGADPSARGQTSTGFT